MKKLFGVWLVISCLSLPVFAGHTVAGGAYCSPCDDVSCICDGNETTRHATSLPGSATTDQSTAPNGGGPEMLLVLATLLLWLRLRA